MKGTLMQTIIRQPVRTAPHNESNPATFASIIGRSSGFSIRLAATQRDREAFQELAYRVYCERLGWLDPEQYPDNRIRDAYDDVSAFLIISDENGLAGGMRIVHSGQKPFPHEHTIRYRLPALPEEIDERIRDAASGIRREDIAEITRFISGGRGKSALGIELVKALYWYGIVHGVAAYFVVIDMSAFLLFTEKIGVPIHPVGIPVFCEGSWSIPGIFFVKEIMASIRMKSQNLWDHISNTSSLAGHWRQEFDTTA